MCQALDRLMFRLGYIPKIRHYEVVSAEQGRRSFAEERLRSLYRELGLAHLTGLPPVVWRPLNVPPDPLFREALRTIHELRRTCIDS